MSLPFSFLSVNNGKNVVYNVFMKQDHILVFDKEGLFLSVKSRSPADLVREAQVQCWRAVRVVTSGSHGESVNGLIRDAFTSEKTRDGSRPEVRGHTTANTSCDSHVLHQNGCQCFTPASSSTGLIVHLFIQTQEDLNENWSQWMVIFHSWWL